MKKISVRIVFGALFLILCSCAVPPSVERTEGLTAGWSVGFTLPSDRWEVAAEPPAFLIEDQVEHVRHELEEQGKAVETDVLRQQVLKRLQASELFVFNSKSLAYLELDLSPIKEGEPGPSRSTVSASANYAAGSLESEEGVSGLTYHVEKARVFGADYAYALEARFLKHEVPTRFYGLVGYASPCWLYFYYHDRQKDPRDYPEMKGMVNSLVLSLDESRP